MYKLILFSLFGLSTLWSQGICQKRPARYLGEPILTDSTSTLFIPTRYNEEFLSANKIALWDSYYANIIAYDFRSDTYKAVFETDTFIESFRGHGYSGYYVRTTEKIKNLTKEWVFLLVKPRDTNGNGRIDEKDPSVLFAVSVNGLTLKQLTDETENVITFENFEKQGFILVKIQRDTDNDKSFKTDDKEFYFRKIDLTNLTPGKGIELK